MRRKVSILVSVILYFCLMSNVSSAQDEDLLLKGDIKKAYLAYNNALTNKSDITNNLNMCRVLHVLNDDKSAKQYCVNALNMADTEKHPDGEIKSYILTALGNIYQSAYRNNDITLDYYKQAENLKNIENTDKYELAELYRNLGRAYYADGQNDLAESYRKKAFETIGSGEKFKLIEAALYNDTAECEIKNKNKSDAIEHLNKAISILDEIKEYENHKFTALVYYNLAKCYEKDKKNKDKYIKYYKKAVNENEMFPYNASESYKVSVTNLSLEDLKNNYDYFPYDIDVNLELGYRYLAINDEIASLYFEKAININPDSGYTYLGIAGSYCEMYLKTGYKEYLLLMNKNMKTAMEKAPYSPKLYEGIGIIKYLLGFGSSAEGYFDKYVEYSDDKAAAHCKLASNYWEADDRKFASQMVIKHIEKALKINPDIDEPYIRMLVSSYRQTGEDEKAESTIDKYLKG